MPDPQPQALHQPTRHLSRATAGSLIHGRLRWLHRLPLVACWHATVSTVPRVQGQGRPPGQATERGKAMTEAAVSFAGNLTDQPEVRYTEGRHRPGHVPGGRLRSAGSRSRRSSP